MNLLIAAEVAMVAALVAGQLMDCVTTYQGIFVQKTEKENGTGLAKLLTRNKYTTLLIKPLVCLGGGIGLFMAANSALPQDKEGGIVAVCVVSAACIGGAIMGFTVGLANKAANAASKAQAKS